MWRIGAVAPITTAVALHATPTFERMDRERGKCSNFFAAATCTPANGLA